MHYQRLGRSGLSVSRICLGGNSWGARGHRAWNAFDAADSRPFFRRALDLGVNFFDTANSYNDGESERVMGQELLSAVPRDELVIATKVGWPLNEHPNQQGLGRKHLLASLDASLRNLRTDHVDLLILHRFDAETPVEETLAVLSDAISAGKIRHLGASTMRPTQFARLQLTAKAGGLPPFVAMQSLYNLIDREDEADLIPFCREEGVGLTPYSPLARGALAGRKDERGSQRSALDKAGERYASTANLAIGERVASLAAARGVTSSRIALNWLLSCPGVVAPVIGVSRLEQIDDAVAALDLSLSESELAGLQAPPANA